MYIKYINLTVSDNIGGNLYRLIFEFHVRYLCNYFSKEIRKFKLLNGLRYDCLNIILDKDRYCRPSKEGTPWFNIEIGLPFSKDRYEKTKSTDNDSYYIELLEQAFREFCSFSNVDYMCFQKTFDKFENKNRKNEWLFKSLINTSLNIKAKFICKFSTNDFELEAIFYDLQSTTLLCRGICIRTKPDEIYFTGIFKSVVVNSTHVIIVDNENKPLILFPIDKIKKRIFHYEFAESLYKDDEQANNTYKLIIEELKYNGNIDEYKIKD